MAEKGTLYQLKQRFDRKNVRKDVKQSVHACREFMRFATYGYVVLAAMKILRIEDKDANPGDISPGASDEAKQQYLEILATSIIESFALKDEDQVQANENEEVERKSNFPCGYYGCHKTFQFDGLNRDLHMANCEFKEIEVQSNINDLVFAAESKGQKVEVSCDKKLIYSCRVLKEGLLDLARVDASDEGDGRRSYIMWKHDFLNFASTGHRNYAELAFTLIAQVEYLLSERKAAQLLHNRTVNLHGGDGMNVPIDYAIELLNGEVKPDLKHRYGNLTDLVIERVGKSLKGCKEVSMNINAQLENFEAIGRHKAIHFEEDVSVMVKELQREGLFDENPGRAHRGFENIKLKPAVNWDKISTWIQQHLNKIGKIEEMKQLVTKHM